jgi:hypothetical protein
MFAVTTNGTGVSGQLGERFPAVRLTDSREPANVDFLLQ